MKYISLFFSQLFNLMRNNFITFIQVVMSFLLPIKSLIIMVFFMIIIDTFIGIWRSYKLKQKITSNRLSKITGKLILYQGSLIMLFCVEKVILGDITLFGVKFLATKLMAATLCYIEIKSINESIINVTGLNLWSQFKEMLTRAKSVKDDISNIIGDENVNENPS